MTRASGKTVADEGYQTTVCDAREMQELAAFLEENEEYLRPRLEKLGRAIAGYLK
jgi:hypothetical protein